MAASTTLSWHQQEIAKRPGLWNRLSSATPQHGTHVFTVGPKVHSLCKRGVDSLGTPSQGTWNECLEASYIMMLRGTRRYQVGSDGGKLAR